MQQKLTICIGLLAFALAGSAPAAAQFVPIYPGPGALAPQEVSAIVRSAGFQPICLFRNGPVYVVRAVDPSGLHVRVLVNARMGRIVRVVPVGMRYAEPYARPPGAIAAVPYGYRPRMIDPDGLDDDLDAPRRGFDGPPVQGRAGAPNLSVHARLSTPPASAQPPLPRPRPKLAAADTSAPPPPKDNAAAVKPAAPAGDDARVAAKPPASPTAGAKPSAAPVEQHE